MRGTALGEGKSVSVTASCRAPLSSEEILDYLSDALGESDEERVESHLFRCADCSSEAEWLAGLVASVAVAVPPVLAPSRLAALEREGRIGAINPMSPGQTAKVSYPESGRLLLHRLGGADLSGARRIDLDLSTSSGETFWHLEDVPFDPARGEVLVACQRHFADLFPPDIVFRVEVVSGDGHQEVARYTVHHQLA